MHSFAHNAHCNVNVGQRGYSAQFQEPWQASLEVFASVNALLVDSKPVYQVHYEM